MAKDKKLTKALSDLVTEALAIEAEEAKEAGAIGYMARAMVSATLPHKRTDGNEFTRTNGAFTLSLLSPSAVGLPYGSVPRLLLSWMTTEAVKTKTRELELGDSLSDFMRKLDMAPTGGKNGSIGRLKGQITRLFASSVTCTYNDGESWALESVKPVDSARLWWSPKKPEQVTLWKSTVTLGERFYDEITSSPVPFDIRALKALKRSPMCLDLYLWLTYRNSYLKKPTEIPMHALAAQFGAEYARIDNFSAAFQRSMKKVLTVYPEARVEKTKHGILLSPSRTHVRKLK